MITEHDRRVAVSALRSAIPYLRLYQGKVFVIKAGGEAFETPERTRMLVAQLGVLHQVGIKIVLLHGGGPQTSRMSRELGLEPRMVAGRRVTDDRTRDVVTMVLAGKLGTEIVAACRGQSIPAVGVTGVDASLITATRRPPRQVEIDGRTETVDYGHVGDISAVDTGVLDRLLASGYLPVVSPVSADSGGAILNLNADGVAAAIARTMKAEKFILVTGVEGIRARAGDASSLVSYTDVEGLVKLEASGAIEGGMLPKVTAIKDALAGGVPRVHVISYTLKDSLLLEVFTNEGSGTLVVRDTRELRPEEKEPEEKAPA
jgi:acetylglutamate kinase